MKSTLHPGQGLDRNLAGTCPGIPSCTPLRMSPPWSWIQRPDTYVPRRVYGRPLGHTELALYHDGGRSGTSDAMQHGLVQGQESQRSSLFFPRNVERAWVDLKQYFPLLGAQIPLASESSSGPLRRQ